MQKKSLEKGTEAQITARKREGFVFVFFMISQKILKKKKKSWGQQILMSCCLITNESVFP